MENLRKIIEGLETKNRGLEEENKVLRKRIDEEPVTTEGLLKHEEYQRVYNKIIQNLQAENRTLRSRLEEKPKAMVDLLKHEVQNNVYVIDRNGENTGQSNSILTRVYSALVNGGCQTLSSLEGKTAKELLEYRCSGIAVVSTIILICKHYGIEIKIDNQLTPKEAEGIRLAIADLEPRMFFID